MKFKKFPDIEQFRHVHSSILRQAQFIGLDHTGDPMYDSEKEAPVLEAIAATKIHGTNGGVGYDAGTGEIWAQSRSSIITPENDNAGFAKFVEDKSDTFKMTFKRLSSILSAFEDEHIYIFGEWCGKGIQKGVAVNELEKMFVIFSILIVDGDDVENWFSFTDIIGETTLNTLNDNRIYHVNQFGLQGLKVDFNDPRGAIEKMNEMTLQVENRCPVASHFGVKGIGEGLVFTVAYNGKFYRWKVKGEKHSKKKPPREKVRENPLLTECVDKITHGWRFQQGMTELFGQNYNSLDVDVKKLGNYLKWISVDTLKEESDIIQEYEEKGLDRKAIMSKVQETAKRFFFSEMNPS